jgi:hypothetical protein
MNEAELTAYVTASRAAQGLPPKIEDPRALARCALLLGLHEPHADVAQQD